MTPRIVCYGDSNTYGYDGCDPFGGRLPANARWVTCWAACSAASASTAA